MKLYILLCLIVAIIFSCVSSDISHKINYRQSGNHLVFHIDSSFSASEREMLNISSQAIYQQTSGLLQIDLIYDSCANNLILKSNDSSFNYDFLGFTKKTPNQIFIYLITDRIKSRQVFQHITMHEMLHAFGLHHLTSLESIMYPETIENPPICLSQDDAWAICLKYRCDIDDLNYCHQ